MKLGTSKLEKAYTFFMMPFYIKDNQSIEPSSDTESVWTRASMNIDKGILYSHIQEFLSKSVTEDENEDIPPAAELASHDYRIYALSPESRRFDKMMDNETEHAIIAKFTVNGEKTEREITFRFNNTAKDLPLFFSPKLIVCPNAKVGILVFSIEITSQKDIESITKLNYALFKTYKDNSSQTKEIYLPAQIKPLKLEKELTAISKSITTQQNSISKLEQRINENSTNEAKRKSDAGNLAKSCEELKKKQQEYETKKEQLDQISKELLDKKNFMRRVEGIDVAFGSRKVSQKEIDIEELKAQYTLDDLRTHCWTMRQLTESLMSEFDGRYERADEFRLHVFTYIQAKRDNSTDADMISNFSRLVRCQDEDYLPLPVSFGDPVYEQLFENIYVGAAVEGGGVLTFLQGTGDNFIKDFDKGPLTHSYLWVYLLVIMQRHTLLRMSRELAEEYKYANNSVDERLKKLRAVMDEMTRTKINTYFTDVSDHSHLNALYAFCCRNLSIDHYFADVENKLYNLKETLEQAHDQQMEIYETEKKKEQEEQTEIQEARLALEKENEKRQQMIGKWIGVIAVILTLFSALSDSYDLFGEDKLDWIPGSISPICHILLLFGAFAIVGGITWKIIDTIQEDYKDNSTNQ